RGSTPRPPDDTRCTGGRLSWPPVPGLSFDYLLRIVHHITATGRLSRPVVPSSLIYGSMTMVQVMVVVAGETVGTFTPVTVVEVSQPVAGELDVVPVALLQVIVADVAPEPPSRKFTWMSDSGVSVNEIVSPT